MTTSASIFLVALAACSGGAPTAPEHRPPASHHFPHHGHAVWTAAGGSRFPANICHPAVTSRPGRQAAQRDRKRADHPGLRPVTDDSLALQSPEAGIGKSLAPAFHRRCE